MTAPRLLSRRAALLLAGGLLGLVLAGCGGTKGALRKGSAPPSAEALGLVDVQATPETRALYVHLQQMTGEHTLFGHQHALAYGVHWTSKDNSQLGRSDVKAVTGSQPALVGFDVLSFKDGVDSVDAEARAAVRERILYTYRYGGVAALVWHAHNPVSRGNAWDTTRAVGAILPGGAAHARYRAMLDHVAYFVKSLRTEGGTLVPVIFRPYHEMNGAWFWWGERHATPAQFARLWQFTVRYLRDVRGVHNLLWAYSPDVFDTRGGYLTRYPGDRYVDVLGFDDYYDFYGKGRSPGQFTKQLRVLGRLARERGKLVALTETGLEALPDSTWWGQTVLPRLKADALTRRVVYVMAWRNAYEKRKQGHFFAPYPGHPSVPDFLKFVDDPFVWMAKDLPPLYRVRSRPHTP